VKELLQRNPACNISQQVSQLTAMLVDHPSSADYHLTTAHKMKGREAAVVQLAEDFVELSPTEEDGIRRLQRCREQAMLVDELNAIYVAVSRAKSVLLLNRDLSRLLLGLHQRHMQLRMVAQQQRPAAADTAAVVGTPPRQVRSAFASTLAASPYLDGFKTPTAASAASGFAAGVAGSGRPSSLPGASLLPSPGTGLPTLPASASAAATAAAARRAAAAAGAAARTTDPAEEEEELQDMTPPVTSEDADEESEEEAAIVGPHVERLIARKRRSEAGEAGAESGPSQRPAKTARREGSTAAGAAAGPSAAAAAPAAVMAWCAACKAHQVRVDLDGAVAGVRPGVSGARPRVLWRGRPVCFVCSRGSVLGQVMELALRHPAAAADVGGEAEEP
ncbi:hypothetical protein Agub_g4504, partial [Astrephomene gubernaculifera]